MQTLPRSDKVVAEFARRRRRHFIALILMLLLVCLLAAAREDVFASFGWHLGHSVVVLGVGVGAAWFSLCDWRCPACGKMLGTSFNPNFCSKCGTPLR